MGAAGVPLGRQGSVDEIAATCLFLVSEDGGFITGQTIHVNGGRALLLICRLTPPAFGRFLGLVERDGFGRLGAALAPPDRSVHLFQGAEPELTVRRLAGLAVRDVMTGRRPAKIDPEIGEQRAWAGYRRRHPGRRYAIARRPLSRAERRRRGLGDHNPKRSAASAMGFDNARARTPTGGNIAEAAPSLELLDQLHLRAVGRGNPAHMPTVVKPLL